jgi:hypothetical protein
MSRALITLFVRGEVRSSKNSRVARKGKGGKTFMAQGKAADAYVNSTADQWHNLAPQFRAAVATLRASGHTGPLVVVIQWHRVPLKSGKGFATFDHLGPGEMVLDCMTGKKFESFDRHAPGFSKRAAWIEDDSASHIAPIFHPVVLLDADKPGVSITLLDSFILHPAP